MRALYAAMTIVLAILLSGWLLRTAYSRVPEPVVVELPPCGDEWVVLPGDTLWGIASRCYPGEHTGAMVAEIRAANPGVDPGRLRVGQVLRLPVATEIAGGGS